MHLTQQYSRYNKEMMVSLNGIQYYSSSDDGVSDEEGDDDSDEESDSDGSHSGKLDEDDLD